MAGAVLSVPSGYRLIWRDADHREHIAHDPYSIRPVVGRGSRFLRAVRTRATAWRAQHERHMAGVLFAVWAPNAERVSVVGFNQYLPAASDGHHNGSGIFRAGSGSGRPVHARSAIDPAPF
jgi:1,4-alpha-glucan branching enzyme